MSVHQSPSPSESRKKITVPGLKLMKQNGEKIAMLTCYDACFATVLDKAGVDIQLIGDSLGMVLAGMSSTLPVTMEQMEYHTRCVAAGAGGSLVLTDMPFGSYQKSPEQAYENAARLMAAGAQMVKIEGGRWLVPTVKFLTERDIPVCAHLGLTPQSVHAIGGYRVQGKEPADAQRLKDDAVALQNAGASIVLFEMIPAALGKEISGLLEVPTIGIGAGVDCDGQVLVLHDMLNIFPGKKARFVKNFMDNQPSIESAVRAYVTEVKQGAFPGEVHSF